MGLGFVILRLGAALHFLLPRSRELSHLLLPPLMTERYRVLPQQQVLVECLTPRPAEVLGLFQSTGVATKSEGRRQEE